MKLQFQSELKIIFPLKWEPDDEKYEISYLFFSALLVKFCFYRQSESVMIFFPFQKYA